MWVITFSTQEMLVFRNAATREVMIGAENKVEQCTYAAVITRLEGELDNEVTGGWKVIEVSGVGPVLRQVLNWVTDGSEIITRIFIKNCCRNDDFWQVT